METDDVFSLKQKLLKINNLSAKMNQIHTKQKSKELNTKEQC